MKPSSRQPGWDAVRLARHPDRPHSRDYILRLAPDFVELHGDRQNGDDPALVAGIGTWGQMTTMFFGQQKGRDFTDRVARNFGMMHAEGYRKGIRLARQAAKFRFPIVSLIDTPGAYPGQRAEEGGLASAIASAILEWYRTPTPVVAVIIGEGGSGGALGMAIADRVLMLENSIYSVSSPEAAAAIVWRDGSAKVRAAEQLHLTAHDMLVMGIIEGIIREPPGGAQVDFDLAAKSLGEAVFLALAPLLENPPDQLLWERHQRFRQLDALYTMGAAHRVDPDSADGSGLGSDGASDGAPRAVATLAASPVKPPMRRIPG